MYFWSITNYLEEINGYKSTELEKLIFEKVYSTPVEHRSILRIIDFYNNDFQ